MTWLAELARGRLLAYAAWLTLASAVVAPAVAATNAPAAARPAAAASSALPAWMELSALATNAAEWSDLAETWRRPDPSASPVEHLTLPVEHYDNGRIRAVLHADQAVVGTEGLIWAWKVAVDMFDPVGAPDGRVDAESCLYDRTARRGYCPTAVKLVRTNATISGTGLYWSMSAQRMLILSNGVVTLRQGIRFPGAGAGQTSGALRSGSDLSQNQAFSVGGTPK